MTFSQPTRKRFGQHWLTSEAVLGSILQAAEVTPQDGVLEIGPGTGVLTQRLLPMAGAVVAVEIDRDLCRKLMQQFGHNSGFKLIQGNFLELDLAPELSQDQTFADRQANKVVANIPYYITGPILEKLLGTIGSPNPHPYESIVLLVQREVAERLYAKPGSRAFGALSVRVQYLAHCEKVCLVPPKAFQPPPKVESAVVKLMPRSFQPAATNPQWLDRLVKLGFSSKRKMLRNNLKSLLDRDQLTTWMGELAIADTARAEDLSVGQWVALSNKIWEEKSSLGSPPMEALESTPDQG